MAILVAFASLPFGLRSGAYDIATATETVTTHVTARQYSPFITITSRPELAQSIPGDGQGEGFTTYTWYDHPFVLRVVFGRNVASLGSINSCATIVRPLPDGMDIMLEETIAPLREQFSQVALEALNHLIAVVRHKARLYHVFDLRRDDIDITVRTEEGAMLCEDPLHSALAKEEEAQAERFDLAHETGQWYQDLGDALTRQEAVSLADDLLIEAERALAQRFPRQAIATCHTAIETAASALLTRGMTRRAMPDREIDELLSTKSLTSKLDSLLRIYTGFSLKHDNHPLWKSFTQLNDMRNDIVHRGKPPTAQDAAFTIQITRDLLRWLDIVRLRNK